MCLQMGYELMIDNRHSYVKRVGIEGQQQHLDLIGVEYFGRRRIKVRRVEMGREHMIVICDRGKVYGWGDNRMGQLGVHQQKSDGLLQQYHLDNNSNGRFSDNKFINYYQKPQRFKLEDYIVDVCLGYYYSILLTSNGQLISYGTISHSIHYEQIDSKQQKCDYLRDQELVNNVNGQRYQLKDKIVKIKSGGNCHIALTYNGHVYAWGLSRYGANMNIKSSQSKYKHGNNMNCNGYNTVIGSDNSQSGSDDNCQSGSDDNMYRNSQQSQKKKLIMDFNYEYHSKPILIKYLDKLQVIEFDVYDDITIISCIVRNIGTIKKYGIIHNIKQQLEYENKQDLQQEQIIQNQQSNNNSSNNQQINNQQQLIQKKSEDRIRRQSQIDRLSCLDSQEIKTLNIKQLSQKVGLYQIPGNINVKKQKEMYYSSKYLQQLQALNQSVLSQKIKQFKVQQIQMNQQEEEDSQANMNDVIDLSRMNDLNQIENMCLQSFAGQNLNNNYNPNSTIININNNNTIDGNDQNQIMQFINSDRNNYRRNSLNEGIRQKLNTKEQFETLIEIMKEDTAKYGKQKKVSQIMDQLQKTSEGFSNLSIVFDSVNQHLSKKCLNNTISSNQLTGSFRNQSCNDKKKYQKLDYEKEKIKNYLVKILKTKNQQLKYQFIKAIKESEHQQVLDYIFSEPESKVIERKSKREQSMENQNQKRKNMFQTSDLIRSERRSLEVVRGDRDQRKMKEKQIIRDIKGVSRQIGDIKLDFKENRANLLEFIRERRRNEQQQCDISLIQNSEYYRLNKTMKLEQQKQMREIRMNQYNSQKQLVDQNRLATLQQRTDVKKKLIHKKHKMMANQITKKVIGWIYLSIFLRFLKKYLIKKYSQMSGELIRFKMVKIFQTKFMKKIHARRNKQVDIRSIFQLRSVSQGVKKTVEYKKFQKVIQMVSNRILVNNIRYRMILKTNQISKSVLQLQRVCRWVNYINDVNIVKIAENFDHNIYQMCQQSSKNNQKKQIISPVYQKMRDNWWKNRDVLSLEEFIKRAKQKSLYELGPINIRKPQKECFIRKMKKNYKNVEMLNQTLLPYSLHNPSRMELLSIQLPVNMQIIKEQLSEELYQMLLKVEVKVKYKVLNQVYSQMIHQYKLESKKYQSQMKQYIQENQQRINLERTRLMLKTPIHELEKMKESVDHLPYSNLIYRIALTFSDSPKKPQLDLSIPYDIFVKKVFVTYFKVFKENYQDIYKSYRRSKREKS